MNDGKDDVSPAETRAIEQALSRAMAPGRESRPPPAGVCAEAAGVREYTELLGLLPYSLAAEEPPARLREQILRRVAVAPASEPVPSAAAVAPFPPPPPRTPWAQLAMAAMLGVCLLGLGLTGALAWKQDRQIDRLRAELASAALARDAGGGSLEAEVRTLRQRLDMITSVARQAYPMRRVPHGDSPGRPEGIIYVCGNHQRWYLSLHGLEPPAAGEEYRLWFMTADGKVDGGALDVRPDTSSEREAMSMPDGTRGFLVTLERQRPETPESLTILLGEKAINL